MNDLRATRSVTISRVIRFYYGNYSASSRVIGGQMGFFNSTAQCFVARSPTLGASKLNQIKINGFRSEQINAYQIEWSSMLSSRGFFKYLSGQHCQPPSRSLIDATRAPCRLTKLLVFGRSLPQDRAKSTSSATQFAPFAALRDGFMRTSLVFLKDSMR